jgi:tetratricopeptide (TPR) repeat protein
MVRPGFVAFLLCSASIAHAGDKPLYQPVPSWIVLAPEPDTKTPAADVPNLLILDSQQRIQADGLVWNYAERAFHIPSAQALAQAGTITLDWQPDHGDLIVHSVDILRNGQRINALKAGQQFTVLRREAGLEKLSLDGKLTATLAVEDLRVGDVLDVRYSTTNKDPALAGNGIAIGPVPALPLKLGFGRTRLLWSEKSAVKWKAFPVGAEPKVADAGGWHELVFTLPVARQPEMPAMTPGRFAKPPIVEASTFADWAAVSKVMMPLYRTDGLIAPGSPLAGEVARIAKAESDPLKRTALALALVQEKVRYLYKGMENGNFIPQSPSQTWTVRYGDCKAKTLLLLAILHALQIEAEPALANLGSGDLVVERLPSPAAFNHIFVVATVNGQKLWLDGTGTGTHLEDIADTPPFGWVLPVRAEGAALVEVPRRVPARPTTTGTVTVDMTGGIDIPAPFDASVTLRGPVAGVLKAVMAQLGKEEQRRVLQEKFAPRAAGEMILTGFDVTFDDAAGTASLALSGVVAADWKYADTRYRYDVGTGAAITIPDRSRATWKDIPIATGGSALSLATTRIRLPDDGKGFALEGADLDMTLPGDKHVARKAVLAGGMMSVETRDEQTGGEIAPADVAAARAKAATLKNQALRITTAKGYPAPWHGIEAAKRAHKFDTVLARYASYIADKPEDADRYLRRARFLDRIFERQKALADLDKAISIQADTRTYIQRAYVLQALGDKTRALADLKAARELDPGNAEVLTRFAQLDARMGGKDEALALLQERIDAEGEDQAAMLASKASLLAYAKDADGALAASDAAIEKRPGSAQLLNGRCWIKATLDVQLDTALKDCTRAIELGDRAAAATALDSRAMVYFRMNRLDEALADLNAALEQRPGAAASLYLRGAIARRKGDAKAGDADLAAARLLSPQIDEDYAHYGIKP